MENNNSMQVTPIDPQMIANLVLGGDLSKMDNTQRVQYYNHLCASLGLNPLTQPFQILRLNGKEVLYAKKDCTEQLRKIHGVSVTELTPRLEMGLCWVTAKVQDNKGRTDAATGAVPIENLKGEALANALMKAETKAKRRATLSICGLGMMDESELDNVSNYEILPVDKADIKTITQTATPTEATPLPAKDFRTDIIETLKSPFFTDKERADIKNQLNTMLPAAQEKNLAILKEKAFTRELEQVIKEIQNCDSMECLQETWTKYKSFQKVPSFISAKDAKKESLQNRPANKGPEEAPKAPAETFTKYASPKQKEEIMRLLNNPVITRQEKTKMLLNINKLDEQRATDAIAKLKKEIAEREKVPVAEGGAAVATGK